MSDDDLPRRPLSQPAAEIRMQPRSLTSGRRRNSYDDTAIISPVQPAGSAGRWPRQRQPEYDSFAILAVIGVLTIVALLGVIVAGRSSEPTRSAPPNTAWVPAPPLASGLPVPVELQPAASTPVPSPTGKPASGVDPLPVGTYNPTTTTKPAAPTTAPAKTPAAPTALLTANTKISLEPADQPGDRIRHRYMWVRVERVDSGSSSADRADATFTVRKGLANSSCFSFESVNVPNTFLRHQNFVLYLHNNDGSALFKSDTTFCPVAGAEKGTIVLRSQNYPDRYLNEHNGQISLDKIAARDATAFRVRPAL